VCGGEAESSRVTCKSQWSRSIDRESHSGLDRSPGPRRTPLHGSVSVRQVSSLHAPFVRRRWRVTTIRTSERRTTSTIIIRPAYPPATSDTNDDRSLISHRHPGGVVHDMVVWSLHRILAPCSVSALLTDPLSGCTARRASTVESISRWTRIPRRSPHSMGSTLPGAIGVYGTRLASVGTSRIHSTSRFLATRLDRWQIMSLTTRQLSMFDFIAM
jgi:hypothetical protein